MLNRCCHGLGGKPLYQASTGGNVPSETFPNQVPAPGPSGGCSFVTEFLHQLYVYRVQYAPCLHWFAVLIIFTEMVLLIHSITGRTGWTYRLKWRPLCHIPEYLRINFALVMSLLTVHSCLLAIVGLQTDRPHLLWPYIALHLGTFLLEMGHLMVGVFTDVPFRGRKFDPNIYRNGPGKWQSVLMLSLLGFNLSIVVMAYLNQGIKLPVKR